MKIKGFWLRKTREYIRVKSIHSRVPILNENYIQYGVFITLIKAFILIYWHN